MSVGNRLKLVRETLNITQTKMAQVLDIAQNNLHRYESDLSKLTTDKLEKLHQFNVSVEWLITGEGEMFREGFEPFDRYNYNLHPDSKDKVVKITSNSIQIPLLDVKASAGSGFINYDEKTLEWISVPTLLLRQYNPRFVKLLEVNGDSMKPTFIDGDWVLVSTQHKELQNERVFVIRINEELKVKRLDKDIRGNIIITSDNPVFKTEELTQAEFTDFNIEIIGLVFGVLKRV